MAETTSGIRLTADASSLVGATEKAAQAQAGLAEQFRKTTDATKQQNDESARFVARLKEEAETLGRTRAEVIAYQAENLKLTDAQRQQVASASQQIEQHERMAGVARTTATVVGVLTAATIAYATATAIGVKNVVNQEAELHNLSQSLGISTQGLSAYQYQMSLAGVTEREFETGMRNLAQRASEAHQGVGRGAEIFGALGISVTDARGKVKSLEQLMPEITDRFSTYSASVNKTTLAGEIFGTKVGERIIPMLNQGSEGFKAAAKEAEEFKRIIGPDMAKQADDFNANMTRINAMFTATKYAIANVAIPALNDFMERLIAAGKTEGDFVQKSLAFLYPPGRENKNWQAKMDAQNAGVAAAFGVGPDGRPLKDAPLVPHGAGQGDPYANATKSLVDLIAVQELELATGEKITQGQRLALQMQPLLDEAAKKGAEAQYVELDAMLAQARANEQALAARDKQKRAVEEATKAYNSGVEAQWKSIHGLEDHNAKLEEHNAEIGKTKSQIDLLKAARAQEVLAIAQENLALVQMHDASDAELQLAQARVKAAEDLVRLLNEGAVKEAAAEGAKHAAEEWKRTSDNIERSLTDALMRGFDKGKSFMQNFKDGLVNAFKTAILTPVIQPLVRPVAGAIAGVVGGITGGGVGGAASGIGGGLNLLSGANTASSFFGGGMAQTAADFGNFFGSIGATTEAGGTFGLMDAIGGFAAANPLAAIGIIAGGALLGGLFGGGSDSPPDPSGLLLRYNQYGTPGLDQFDIGGGSGKTDAMLAMARALNDPAQYDQAALRQIVGNQDILGVPGQWVLGAPGASLDSLLPQLSQLVAPAGQAVQTKNAALLAQLQGGGSLAQSLSGYVSGMAVSDYLSPEMRLSGAQTMFENALGLAGSGDAAAGQALPGLANQLLGAGRSMYASGPQFQELFTKVNSDLARVLDQQGQAQQSLLADMPVAIKDAAADTVKAIQALQKQVKDGLDALNAGLRQFQATGAA